MSLTNEDLDSIRIIVKECNDGAMKAVKEMFISVGIDINNPKKEQEEKVFLAQASQLANNIVSKIVIGTIALFGVMAVGWAAITKIKPGG